MSDSSQDGKANGMNQLAAGQVSEDQMTQGEDTPSQIADLPEGDPNALRGGLAADALFGDIGDQQTFDPASSQTLIGSENDDHVWEGAFAADDSLDVFIKQTGTGTDYIHDFEVEADVVDLSAYNISFLDLQGAMQDVGWATQIELTGFSGQVDDRIYLKNVEPDQLDESNFTL